MAEAYTVAQGAGCAAAKITDEGFSYSARGELTSVFQSSPHSGGYYLVNATYWPHGTLQSFSGLPGMPTISYNLDGQGRTVSVAADTGSDPVSAVSYNTSSQPTSLTLGSGDSSGFSYDSNTGRMTQYQSNINGQTVSGNLGWNTNGSLAQVATTDPFNSANNQVCGYTYDDLGRLTTTNCGPITTTWNANGGTGISHWCGRPDGDGWSVNVFDDPPGCWFQYGPYTTQLGAGSYVAQWTLLADNNSADNNTILRLDVNDATTTTQLAYMYVTREQFTSPNVYQTFSLPFALSSNQAGHQIEFRVFWYGYSYIREKSLDYASSSGWAQTFGFDPFGNISKSGSISFQAGYSTATNRITSLPGFTPTYDSSGNLTNDSSHTYSWDADGHAVAIDSVVVSYDALGRIVEQNKSGTYYQIVYGPTGGKLAIMNGQTVQKQFVPLPGGATAVYTSTGLSYYRHPDWLGSSRLASTPSRGIYSDAAYAPYGEPYAQSGTSDLSFTGQNQDTMAGLYDFMYREYHPTQGRWLSPDPAGLAAVDLSNPQSLNRYAYALNSPTNLVDPLGLNAAAPWDDDGGGGGIPGFCPAQYSFEDCGYGGGGGWFPPIPIPGGGGGGGGGGTGGSTGSGSGPNTGGLPPTGGETLGIPNGFPIGGLSMCQLMGLCPIGPDCEFGACTPIPSGYVTGVSGNGTSQSPFTISVFVWASMHICGDFICDQHGNTVSLAPPNIRGIQPTNIEFDILLGGFYLSRINSNPFLRIGPGYVKGGRKILRVVSGGPGVGWWWHIWDGPTWPF